MKLEDFMCSSPDGVQVRRGRKMWGIALGLAFWLSANGYVLAQPAPAPYLEVDPATDPSVRLFEPQGTDAALELELPSHLGIDVDDLLENSLTDRKIVYANGAIWLRIQFATDNEAFDEPGIVVVRSHWCQQTFTARTLNKWEGRTFAFRGPEVEVIQIVPRHADNPSPFYKIGTIIKGLPRREAPRPMSLCGSDDDRVSSNDPRVGRVMPAGCTAFILQGNSKFVTAGHCLESIIEFDLLEFGVGESDFLGSTQPADCRNQYKIDKTTVVHRNDGSGVTGDDWAVFAVEENTETGLFPIQAQGAFFSVSNAAPDDQVRITGYGLDDSPNESNQTQQTHVGDLINTVTIDDHVTLQYTVDTQRANSGSPIISTTDGSVIGVHTDSGCNVDGSVGNKGTGFQNEAFWSAVEEF